MLCQKLDASLCKSCTSRLACETSAEMRGLSEASPGSAIRPSSRIIKERAFRMLSSAACGDASSDKSNDAVVAEERPV